jgi:hypothetical protein
MENRNMSYEEALKNSHPAVITDDIKTSFVGDDGERHYVDIPKGTSVTYLMDVSCWRCPCRIIQCGLTENHPVHVLAKRVQIL